MTGRASGNTDTDTVIPATASDGSTTYKVMTIGEDAFADNTLTSVTIGNKVEIIGDGANHEGLATLLRLGGDPPSPAVRQD